MLFVLNQLWENVHVCIYKDNLILTRFIAHLREGLSFLQISFAYRIIESTYKVYTVQYCTYIRVCHIFLKAKNQWTPCPIERQVFVDTTEI